MNAFKIFQTAILILVLSILAGCSDEVTSPITGGNTKHKKVRPEVQENYFTNVYQKKITLNPHQSCSFSYENTGFYIFNSISVSNCEEIKNDIEIAGYINDVVLMLECDSKGFWVKSITITNISEDKTELDLILTGSKTRVPDPKTQLIYAD